MRLPVAVLLACLALAPAAIADSPPGDTSPSYGGSGGGGSGSQGSAPDKTAPFVDITISVKHLASLARAGRLRVQVVVSEDCKLRLSGSVAVGSGRAALTAKQVTLKKGLRTLTLKLSSKRRKALKGYVRGLSGKRRGKVALTGTATDPAGNKRHLSFSKKLKR